jgi:transcriptional regulator with GAF, ATPase, and Fis domain
MDALTQYDWPGNIRELQNVIERAVITSHLGKLDSGIYAITHSETGTAAPVSGNHSKAPAGKGIILTDAEIRQLEKENMIEALRVCNGKVYGRRSASEKLGLKPTTLLSRLKKMGITFEHWHNCN